MNHKDHFQKFKSGIASGLRGLDLGDTDYRDVMSPNMRRTSKRLEAGNLAMSSKLSEQADRSLPRRTASKSAPKR